jgi:hypothetical protein
MFSRVATAERDQAHWHATHQRLPSTRTSPPLGKGGLGGYQAHHVHNDEVSEHYRSKDRALNCGQVT